MSTLSDTLPFKDHSATDRKGVPLDFTASSPLPAPLLVRDMPFSFYTPVTLLSLSLSEFSFNFPLFRSYSSVNLLSSSPLDLPRLGVPCPKGIMRYDNLHR